MSDEFGIAHVNVAGLSTWNRTDAVPARPFIRSREIFADRSARAAAVDVGADGERKCSRRATVCRLL